MAENARRTFRTMPTRDEIRDRLYRIIPDHLDVDVPELADLMGEFLDKRIDPFIRLPTAEKHEEGWYRTGAEVAINLHEIVAVVPMTANPHRGMPEDLATVHLSTGATITVKMDVRRVMKVIDAEIERLKGEAKA